MKIHMDKFDDGSPKLVVEHTIEELKDELGEVKGENLLLKYENKNLKKQIKELKEKINYYESENENYYKITEKDLLDMFLEL